MTIQIYDTAVLNRVVETLVNPVSFFLTNYFGSVETSDSETIMFDVTNDRRRITPFVSPLVQGKVIEGYGYSTKSFSPAYVKDKRVFNPNKAFKRLAGERVGGSLTPAARLQAQVAFAMEDQLKMLNRRLEVMAAEALVTGGNTIVGDDYPLVNINYGRDPSLTVALAGAGQAWNNGGTPLQNIEDWSELVFAKSGAVAKTVVCDLAAWKLLKADPQFDKLLSTIRRDLAGANISTGPTLQGIDSVRYMGYAGDFSFYVYSGRYVDPADNTEKPILPANTVLLLSENLDGVQHYGAIRDLQAGIQPRPYFVKSWEQEDPSVRWLLMQSAPLTVPYRVNASLAATVA